ncbi:MAG: hypothetical protein QOF82_737 [Frankiales bacterium]|nr:hypothetical protein [Frankiales bacterium]
MRSGSMGMGMFWRRGAWARAFAVVTAITSLVGLAVGGGPAHAATIGNATFSPASGDGGTVMTLVTSGPCLHGTNFQVFVSGSGFPSAGTPVTASTSIDALAADSGGGYSVALTGSMDSFAAAQSPAATLSGTYTFTGRCTDPSGSTTLDTYAGAVDFTQNGGGSATYVAQVEVQFGYFTATALSASPAGPVNAGASVTFTAHVASSPVGGAIGTVQLREGGTDVGGPATVDSAGNAVVSTSFATGGDHTVTAAFTGKFAFITDSVSPPLVLTVNAAPADPTTTALSISPVTATTADTVTLSATVADTSHPSSTPRGTVQFADHGTALGSLVALDASGGATVGRMLSAGSHLLTASFVPTDPAVFDPSSSTSEPYAVTQAAGSQTIETTVDPGALTISVADTTPVVLSSPVLNAAATFLTTTGVLHPVTVTDTRAGSPGWAVSAQVSDFRNVAAPAATPINGFDLGWTPEVVDRSLGQTIVAGDHVDPADPPVTSDLPAGDPRGLKLSRLLASAAPGDGTGTAHLGAQLTLNVPTTVAAGTYEATLTLTAI